MGQSKEIKGAVIKRLRAENSRYAQKVSKSLELIDDSLLNNTNVQKEYAERLHHQRPSIITH